MLQKNLYLLSEEIIKKTQENIEQTEFIHQMGGQIVRLQQALEEALKMPRPYYIPKKGTDPPIKKRRPSGRVFGRIPQSEP